MVVTLETFIGLATLKLLGLSARDLIEICLVSKTSSAFLLHKPKCRGGTRSRDPSPHSTGMGEFDIHGRTCITGKCSVLFPFPGDVSLHSNAPAPGYLRVTRLRLCAMKRMERQRQKSEILPN
jgi:hypothetical protein